MTDTTTQTTTSTDEQPSLAQEWFTAILTGDSKRLLTYGLTKEQVTELDTTAARSDAAKLLLQSENTKARSTSKRIQAAEAGILPKGQTTTLTTTSNVTPMTHGTPKFYTSVAAASAARAGA